MYSIFLTAEDIVGNSKTINFNYKVDNTPPLITATINPNTLKFIDFANDRSIEITAQSSPDTKSIYAFIDNSWRVLKYLNGYWTYKFSVPHIVSVGIHNIQLKAIDYAGNEATTSVSYYVYDNLGLDIGTENSQGGSTGSSDGFSGNGENGGSSSGSNNGSNGDSSSGSNNGSNGDSSSTGGSNASNILLFGLIMLFILIAIAGLFLVALLFGPELFIILTAIVGAAAILSIPFDVWDIINYLYNLIFADVGLIETMLVLLSLAGIILEAPVLLSLIGLTILFIIVAMLLFKFL